jgi:hypothetical protein
MTTNLRKVRTDREEYGPSECLNAFPGCECVASNSSNHYIAVPSVITVTFSLKQSP